MEDIKLSGFLITKTTTVKEALRKLDEGGEKIIYVVDDSNRLHGSLTDGDIRRWILSNGDLMAAVDQVCNTSPISCKNGFDLEDVKALMLEKNILSIPVVTEEKVVVEILWWEKIFKSDKKKQSYNLNIPVIIMAGGKGTRLDPFTRILPKPLIPIGDQPIISIIMNKFMEYDVSEFYISVNHKSKIIKAYFEEIEPNYNIQYVYEDKPLGTAGALKFLDGQLEGDFFISNCDIIIEANYKEILDHHRKNDYDLTLVASLKHYNIPYGVCELNEDGSLIEIREKPEFDFLVNTGMYVVNSRVLKHIPMNEFYHITHLMEDIKKRGGKVGVFPVGDKAWIDIGEWAEYKKALSQLNL